MLENICYRHPDQTVGIICQCCHRPICPRYIVAGSVEFRCPGHVAASRRQTRQGQLPCGDAHSARPTLTSQVLVGINAVTWPVILLAGGKESLLFRMFAIQTRGFYTTKRHILAVDSPAQRAAIEAT